MSGTKALIKPTLQVTLMSLLGIAINFVTQLAAAYKFGVSSERDAYFGALVIPTYLIAVLIGSFGMIFLPSYIDIKTNRKAADANVFFFNSVTLVGLVTAVIAIVCSVFARQLLSFTVPGFTGSQLSLSAELLVILMPMVVLQILTTLSGSVLQAQHRFILPALTPLIASMITLASLWTLSGTIGIKSLAYGTLAGNIVSCVITFIVLKKDIDFKWDIKGKDLAKLVKVSAPLLLAGLFYRLTSVFERGIASFLPEGSVSILGYANQIMIILATITSSGIATTFYPMLSKAWSESNFESLRNLFIKGIRIILIISFPLSVIFTFVGTPLIGFLIERGAIDHVATVAISKTFAILTIALIANNLGGIIAKVFYFSGRTILGSTLEVMSTLSYIGLAFLLSRYFSYKGLAWASSLYTVISISASFISLYFIVGGLNIKKLFSGSALILLSAVIPMLLIVGLLKLINVDVASLNIVIAGVIIVMYLSAYYALLMLFRAEEVEFINNKGKALWTKIRMA